jgi:uncharacterized membrane protein (UPF0127 family)
MQKKVLFCACILSLVLSGCRPSLQPTVQRASDSAAPLSLDAIREMRDRAHRPLRVMSKQDAGTRLITVEVVHTPESIAQGLSGRDEIGSDGMLFVFPAKGQQVFWMPDMKFDIDIVWLREGMVVGILPNVPKPERQGQDRRTLPKYPSQQDVDMVLEVPAGTTEQWKLQVGDALELL